MTDSSFRLNGRLILGLLVIAVGVLFTLDNLGLVDAGGAVRWWPALLVVYGLLRLTGLGCRRYVWFGTFCVAVGGWMLLHAAGLVHASVWALWPVLLILWGVAVLRGSNGMGMWVRRDGRWERYDRRELRRARRAARDAHASYAFGTVFGTRPDQHAGAGPAAAPPGATAGGPDWASGQPGAPAGGGPGPAAGAGPRQSAGPGGPEPPTPGDWEPRADEPRADFKLDVILSTVTRRVTSQQFTHGEVLAIMGGASIDLRPARMAAGESRIALNVCMGEVILLVPEDWTVEFHGSSVMGTVDDRSRRPAGEPAGRLVITGGVGMGSIVVKN